MTVFYHADDFGVTVEQSRSIMDCYYKGRLNSVSIIPNSAQAAESYRLIDKLVDQNKLRLVVHLNFVEGPCMAYGGKDTVPHLVDEAGNFNCSYGRMLKLDKSPEHNKVRDEFAAEISAQIAAVVELTGDKTISVDSHQHYLQIPMIWEAFIQVIADEDYTLKYVRIPVDPMGPVWSTPGLLFKVPPINFVKWALLKKLTPDTRRLCQMGTHVPVFFGIPFTCQMTQDRVEKLLPKYMAIAEKQDRDLELMFHPGAVRMVDDLMDANQQDLVEFYGSKYRDLEKETLCSI